jgi:FAD:protein FMN transferase
VNGVDTFRAMGCEIVVGGASAPELSAVRKLFADRDATFSRFRPDSELTRINRSRATLLHVSPAFAEATRAALAAADATLGLVDPTLLDALEAAGYDADFASLRPDPRPPGAPVPGNRPAVRLAGRLLARPPGLRLDLNGVVKAMAVDDALGLLAGPGFVSAGGDLAARGPLEVALPRGGSVRLERGALATSGSATRRWWRAGSPQHHLIDPRSGRPAESPWEAVTVCGATCLAADVAAKAAFLLGEEGPSWLDRRGIPGRFVRHDGGVLGNERWRQTADAEPACI